MATLLRIYLTLGVSSATAERTFSRLKLIKTYRRTTMGEDRLNNLALISIESNYIKNIDLDVVMDKFKIIKTRRMLL